MANIEIYEIFEVVFSVLIFLTLIFGIFVVADPDTILANTVSKQVSYVSTLSLGDTVVEFDLSSHDGVSAEVDSNEISVQVEGSSYQKSSSFGSDKSLRSDGGVIVLS